MSEPNVSQSQYALATTVGLLATQAQNGTIFSFRWANASLVAIIRRITLTCMQTSAATATINPRFDVFVARSFTASDSAGTALTITGNAFKRKTGFKTTGLTNARISAAASGLTVGTRTVDSAPMLSLQTTQLITTPGTMQYQNTFVSDPAGGDHPIVLAANEGIVVIGPSVAFGAAGTADLTIEMAWSELPSY